jgi:hypothetical protein
MIRKRGTPVTRYVFGKAFRPAVDEDEVAIQVVVGDDLAPAVFLHRHTQTHAHEGQARVLQFLFQLLEQRHHAQARHTPRGPHVYHHQFAAQVAELQARAIGAEPLEVEGLLSGLRPSQLVFYRLESLFKGLAKGLCAHHLL